MNHDKTPARPAPSRRAGSLTRGLMSVPLLLSGAITGVDAGDSFRALKLVRLRRIFTPLRGPGSGLVKTCRRAMQGLVCGFMLQASGCTFDAESFLTDSLTAVYNNVATTFIITALADLLNVAPTFGF